MMDVTTSVVEATMTVLVHIILAILFLFSTAANVLVLIIFYRKPALRTLSNRFVMSLFVFNLIAVGILLPLFLVDSLINVTGAADAQTEQAICISGQVFSTFVTTGSLGAALVIAMDQYCAIMAPLHYHRRITKFRAWLLLAAHWLYAVAMSTFSLSDSAGKKLWRGCGQPFNFTPSVTDDNPDVRNDSLLVSDILNGTSDSDWDMSQVWTPLFVTTSTVFYVVPMILLTWMYVRIYSAAHRNSERTRRSSLTHSASELVVHALSSSQAFSGSASHIPASSSLPGSSTDPVRSVPSRTPSLRSTSSQIVHNLRYRISNASLFLYREESRAARVSAFVLVSLLVCWLPYHAVLIYNAWPGTLTLPTYTNSLVMVAVLLNSLISPFLYAYRSRRIQREVRRLFGLPPKSRKKQLMQKQNQGLASNSPRRLLLKRQLRTGEAVCLDEIQAALTAAASRPSTSRSEAKVQQPEKPAYMRTLLLKVTKIWKKPPPNANTNSILLPLSSNDNSRLSFSSVTSSSAPADSDISL